MKRRIMLGLAVAGPAILTAASAKRFNHLQSIIDQAVSTKQIPGAVVAIAQNGRTIYSSATGLGDIESNRKIKTDDIFMIASSTKPIAATGILILVDQRKIGLDDPVSQFFPESSISSTVRQLLSHTSGIFGNAASPESVQWIRDFNRPLNQAVAGILKVPLESPAGTKFSYGGASFCIAGGIVEKVTGLDVEEYFRKSVFEPVGMKDTCYRSENDLSSRIPTIYQSTEKGFLSIRAVMETAERRGPRANGFVLVPGGIYSTADDLLRFLSAHLDGERILSHRLQKEMRKKQTGTLATEYGLGWYRYRTAPDGTALTVGHGGAYGTDIWIDLERKIGVAVLVQATGPQIKLFQQAVRAEIERSIPRNS